jgi:hypothetical protein
MVSSHLDSRSLLPTYRTMFLVPVEIPFITCCLVSHSQPFTPSGLRPEFSLFKIYFTLRISQSDVFHFMNYYTATNV